MELTIKNLLTTPTGIAVAISTVFFVVLVIIGAAIGGSYALTLASIHHNNQVIAANQKALHIREIESQIRSSIPTCKALIEMDDAKIGASNASSDPHSYGHQLAKAITHVVDVTHCRQIVREVNEGVPIIKIVRQFDKSATQ